MPRTPLEGRKADGVPFALAWAVWKLQDGTCLHIVLAVWTWSLASRNRPTCAIELQSAAVSHICASPHRSTLSVPEEARGAMKDSWDTVHPALLKWLVYQQK